VVKLVDAGDSKSPAARRAGSIPALGTNLSHFSRSTRSPLFPKSSRANRLPERSRHVETGLTFTFTQPKRVCATA
jgi:hypothetical protein